LILLYSSMPFLNIWHAFFNDSGSRT
jgi:hypothetical protein